MCLIVRKIDCSPGDTRDNLNHTQAGSSDPATEAIGVSVAVDIAASGNKRVKREIVSPLKARNLAGGDVLLRPGTVIEEFRIVRSAEPGAEIYVAHFISELRELSCPLHAFLPRTCFVQVGETAEVLSRIAATA